MVAYKANHKTTPAVKVVTQSVINARKPTEIKGLRAFFVVKRGEKPTDCFTPLKQDMAKYIQNVMQKAQYIVFWILTINALVWYTGQAPPLWGRMR